MNKIIEINNEALAAVSGGCYCYCYTNPFNPGKPTELIGGAESKEDCHKNCIVKSLVYSHCASELPRKWESPLEFTTRMKSGLQL